MPRDGNRLMNVLLIAPQPFFTERGTPIAVRQLAEALCADGHRVDLLTYPFGDDVEIDGLTIHRCRRFPGIHHVGIGFSLAKLLMDLMLVLELWGMGKRGRYDTVHAVEESVYLALLLRRRHRARVIYDMDSSLAEQLADSRPAFRVLLPMMRLVERWAIRSADQVVAVCDDLARYASKTRDKRAVAVLHDVPAGIEGASDSAAKLWRGSSAARCLALYVGNLGSNQGIDLLIDAVALLPEDCPVRVVVAGGPMDAAERYRAIAGRRGLERRLRFVGPRPMAELKSMLAQADILLSPRTQGGNTPLKLYSYMDSKRPILATRLRAHTQVLDDSTALLVEADGGAFARGLVRLAEDQGLRQRLAEAAKRRVIDNYSLSIFKDRVRDIYAQRAPNGAAYASTERGRVPSETRTTLAGASRRSTSDRRRPRDRRTTIRGAADRRVRERRVLAYA